MIRILCLCAVLVAAPLGATGPQAELFATHTSDRVLLHGLHYRPDQPSRHGVIHLPGGPGAFYSIQDMGPVAAALKRNGYHFFSVNSRTAGVNGMFYARFEDYLLDVGAAVAYARSEGVTDIVLLGQSLGAARAVYYTARTDDPSVRGLILTAAIPSPYLEAQARWNAEQRRAFDEFLAKQRRLIAQGRARELSSWPWWGNERLLELSAGTWISVFGAPGESDASTVEFAADIELPVLLVHGGADETVGVGVAREVLAAFTGTENKKLVVIEAANHLFLGHEEELARIVIRWLQRNLPVEASGAGSG